MNMEEPGNMELFGKILTGNAQEDEMIDFRNWLSDCEDNRSAFESYKKIWESGKVDKNYDLIRAKERIEYKINQRRNRPKRIFNSLEKVAAILFLPLLILSVYLYSNLMKPGDQELETIYQTVDCPIGNRSKINLPDGTMVWLNSGSSITFPVSFSEEKKRQVSLSGEAYFKVVKDLRRPFILSLGEVTMRVTGTSFNVVNYLDEEQIEVMLESGKVDLYTGSDSKSDDRTRLVPGQLARIEKGTNRLTVNQVNAEQYVSWTEGYLVFDEGKMSEVIRKLRRWYNVEIEVVDQEINDYSFTATIKEETLDQFLDLLVFTSPIEYEIEKVDQEADLPVKQRIFLRVR
jgi:transmembrane sensor